MRRIAFALLTPILALGLFAACITEDDDTPVSATPDTSPQPAGDDPLQSIRLDLAERLAIDATEITIAALRSAGWDGCYGIVRPDVACDQRFVGGVIAELLAEDERYRYHLVGEQFFPVAFMDGITVNDGSDVPWEIAPDLAALMAGWARGDLALRLDIEPDDVVIETIAPEVFSGSCVGFLRAGQTVCTTDAAPGAIVFLRAEEETYRYHVLESGGIRAVDFEDGRVTQEPNADYVTVQQAMREDLADHLNADASEISMRSFREVTWADGCMGVRRPDVLCSQALVDG
ncbi:MAG: hypothetical protein ACSLFM_07765, partial [Tepidiformaceae bacterium]